MTVVYLFILFTEIYSQFKTALKKYKLFKQFDMHQCVSTKNSTFIHIRKHGEGNGKRFIG